MVRVLASWLILCAGFSVWAEDKKEDKKQPIKGIWTRDVEGIEIKFSFKTAKELIIDVTAGDNGVSLTCEYSADKDGKVKATVKTVKEKGEFPDKPPEGYEFKFVFKVEKDSAKLSEFEGDNAEQARMVIEGEYKAKSAD